ncbi:MAG: autotransporter outer membrane beta-barrel domain-containing protein [Pseudomonadota bacterium]
MAGTIATCTGNLSAGVDADGPTIDTLNINGLTQNIGNTGATSSIDFDTTNGNATVILDLGAFQAFNTAAVTAVVDVSVLGAGNVDINTTGNLIHNGLGSGIIGSVTGNGNVLILSQGDVAAQGAGINGFVTNNGNVTVQSVGNINIVDPTVGLPAFFTTPTGILAGITNNGDISINSTGNISVSGGGLGSGIRANNFVGFAVTNVNIVSNGNINVTGALVNSFGINGGTETGNMNINSTGDITADTGILSLIGTVGDSTIQSTGNIAGLDAGIQVLTPSGRMDVTVGGGTVSGADGITAALNATTASTISVLSSGTVRGNGAGATNRAIEVTGSATNISVAGSVIGNSGNAIQFAPGTFQDRLELFPTFNVTGVVFADADIDTLRFNGPGNGNFDLSLIDTGTNTQQYRQFEIFEVNNGVWTFSNATTASFVANGGTTTGNATFGGLTINNGAILAPGVGQGSMNVTGNLVFNNGGILNVDISPDGTSDIINVGGTTTIAGGTTLNASLNPLVIPTNRTVWTVIDSTAGVTGQFGTVTDNLPDVDLLAVYNPTTVQLVFTPTLTAAGTSPKEIHPSSLMAALDSSLLFVESLRRRGNLESLLPDQDQSLNQALGFMPLSGSNTSSQAFPDFDQPDVYLWGAAIASYTDVGADKATPGWDATEYGFALGLEKRLTTNTGAEFTTGISAGYIHTDVGVSASNADIDSWYLGIYGATELDQFLLSGAAAYAYHNFNFDRSFGIGAGAVTATADAGGHGFSGSFEAFYNVLDENPDQHYFGPIATLGAAYGNRGAFTETGAGLLNLEVSEDEADYAKSGIGIAVGKTAKSDDKTFKFDARVQWEHIFGNTDVTTVSNVPLATATFSTASASIDRDRLGIGLGIGIDFSETKSAHIRYNGSFGSSTTSNDLSAGLTFKF